MDGDRAINEALVEQDFLYGVLERDVGVENYRVIGSLVGHHYAAADPAAVIARLASPECEIISLTVTEGGYFLDDGAGSKGGFRADDAGIRRDLERPEAPTTWVGYVAAAAERRMQSGGRPIHADVVRQPAIEWGGGAEGAAGICGAAGGSDGKQPVAGLD